MSDTWFVIRDGQRHGPYTAGQMQGHVKTGHLLPIDLVIQGELSEPIPAGNLLGLFPGPSVPAGRATASPQATPTVRPRVVRVTPRHVLMIGGIGVAVIVLMSAVTLLVKGIGRKPHAGVTGEPTVAAAPGADPTEAEAEPPDFTQVDYTLDTSKINYEQGPNGEPLVRKKGTVTTRTGLPLLMEMQGYVGGDGKMVQHGVTTTTHHPPASGKAEEDYYYVGQQHGRIAAWFENGQKRYEGTMREGKKHGKWQEWHDTGKRHKEEWFLNGVRHGSEASWYADGTKEYESSFMSGDEHGRRTDYWEDGTKATVLHFRRGVRHGPATWWDKGGRVSMRLHFRNGETNYDPTKGTCEDFATALENIFPPRSQRSLRLQAAFSTFGRPTSGFADISDLVVGQRQEWAYHCSDGPVVLTCFLRRNDRGIGGTWVDFSKVRKR